MTPEDDDYLETSDETDLTKSSNGKGVPSMPETTNNEAYQPMTFDAIKIGLASPEKILRVVSAER